ncbi:MAG TPA: hypothetical protein VF139_10210 [Candidatus Polarisedimenticolaceae bacterium]
MTATVVVVVTGLAVLQWRTPGRVLCLFAQAEAAAPPSSHDTNWAYCRTELLLREYRRTDDPAPVYDWLLRSQLDGGIAMTAWLRIHAARPEGSAELRRFENQLRAEERETFRVMYGYTR